jgi:hypothetical protein
MIGGPALSKDIFYSSNKNGGFGLRLLAEIYQACKNNTRADFLQRNQETRNLMNCQFNEEKRKRSVKAWKKDIWFLTGMK